LFLSSFYLQISLYKYTGYKKYRWLCPLCSLCVVLSMVQIFCAISAIGFDWFTETIPGNWQEVSTRPCRLLAKH